MTPYWFSKKLPASRHGIENALRLAFWAQGFGDSYFTCTQPETPVKCVGLWKSDFPLNVEWTPSEYFTVTMNEPNKDALEAFERVLGHHATAAYRNAEGKVVIEWRVKDASNRFAELAKSGVTELERLS
ncbi:MAG: hypothetical protein B6D41_20730 [Chloroflexi bacterium UTCFX4]|jgi:hypothetical protein|nr:MAG: hypothetical protein B6D41_20730 [Chloroflexi bacterium UTCFX4]